MPSELDFCRDNWAKTQSLNKAVKVYLGTVAARGVDGHLSSQALIAVARDTQKKYSSFGGVMLWDADTAYSEIILSGYIFRANKEIFSDPKIPCRREKCYQRHGIGHDRRNKLEGVVLLLRLVPIRYFAHIT
jgi:hypothetical protein